MLFWIEIVMHLIKWNELSTGTLYLFPKKKENLYIIKTNLVIDAKHPQNQAIGLLQ